ncbi:MAG: ATPase [Chthonomonadaceae bacterium]|nr:ATPase [Chthonomonadaceae bacterium]
MRQCKRSGCRTLLLTSRSLEHGDWPRESLDDAFYIADKDKEWVLSDMIKGVSFLARTERFDRIIALDDFDVEKAAMLREHLRVPGMGDTTSRYFRDKLAMRVRARNENISVPRFCPILNYDDLRTFLDEVSPPYLLKPRSSAGTIGIKKIEGAESLWRTLDELGDLQSFYILEEFIPGDIFHVDTIVDNKKTLFSLVSKYGKPPLEVSHEGRVFTSGNVLHNSDDDRTLKGLNKLILKAFGYVRGVSHSEYIKAEDGTYYFLETSARVAGAHIAEMIGAATGVDLWAEWAKLEITPEGAGGYMAPVPKNDYAGLLVSLSKQETPDLSAFDDPEIFWKMNKKHHVGLAVSSPDFERTWTLVTQYNDRIYAEFFTSLSIPGKASS